MKHTDVKVLFSENAKFVNQSVTVCGWVRTWRDSKSIAFIELNDGTSLKNLQLVIEKDGMPENEVKPALVVGAALCVTGKFIPSERNGFELSAQKIQLLGACPQDYPLQKKHHTLEFLRTIPHLRPRTKYFEAVFAVRSRISFAIHNYFQTHNYKYVHTPIITGSDCEGAGEMFRVTTQSWNAKYKTENEYFAEDFFGAKAGLTVSGQLEGEIAAMGLGKIYTFGPTFRAEHSNTTRHAAEFWQIEPEVCFADLHDIIEIAEDFIKSIIKDVVENCPDEIAYFDERIEKGLKEKLSNVINSDFAKITYTQAVEVLKKSGKEFKFPVEWGSDLQTEHERYLTEEYYKKPVFVTDYPADIKAFYMKLNSDNKTVAATDLLVPGIGEIIGCSEREADSEKLKSAMLKRNMPLEAYTEYLDTRKYGSVPHSGFGLGLERIIMYITGVQNIRDTLLYPRTVGSL
ncbi:MAG: asparagine--tRNA ligase [Clostridia bacterium]|nr:asparagine--tRNA ligase [Clostridia bacterium]